MPRVLLTRRLPDAVIAAAEAVAEVEMRDNTVPMNPGECAGALTVYDGIVPTLGDAFNAVAFDKVGSPRCKILANFGVGYNHIDVDAAKAAGLVVTNTPGAVTDATADIAITLMLMTARRAGEGERLLRAGKWDGWHPTQLLGMHLGGKVLGIIGMGRIGKAIAKRAHLGFGMEVVFYNRSAVPDPGVPARQLPDLRAVCEAADVVVLAVPATPDTHHLMNADLLIAMKPTTHLINIARGDVVDEAALIDALQAGQIAGAGLDVYEFEPKVPEALIRMENVTLLPHLGTAALEVRTSMGLMAVDNLRTFFAKGAPPNLV